MLRTQHLGTVRFVIRKRYGDKTSVSAEEYLEKLHLIVKTAVSTTKGKRNSITNPACQFVFV
jgi:hypothetical protein